MAQQLGFGFGEALEAQETTHLPGEMSATLPVYRRLIESHDRAMRAADESLPCQSARKPTAWP